MTSTELDEKLDAALDLYYGQRYHTVSDSNNDGLVALKQLISDVVDSIVPERFWKA